MSTNKLTTVNTTYARIAVMLLAFNMLLTGYVVMALNGKRADDASQTKTSPAASSEVKKASKEETP